MSGKDYRSSADKRVQKGTHKSQLKSIVSHGTGNNDNGSNGFAQRTGSNHLCTEKLASYRHNSNSNHNKEILDCPRPFVKWAGGKRQLIPVIEKYLPKTFDCYFEPFLGGGAVFFRLLYSKGSHDNEKKNSLKNTSFHVSDLNPTLVLAYDVIRNSVEQLIKKLEQHAARYFEDPQQYYYSVRESQPRDKLGKVARLIFLNRTCYNGLYRVNTKGRFNVPFGRYSHPNIVNKENLYAVSRYLGFVDLQIKCQDFATTTQRAQKSDFVYFDPPYHPVSDTANFTSYTNGSFPYQEQLRLYKEFKRLDDAGCKVMLSNSKSDEIANLYSEYKKTTVEIESNRCINSNASKRVGHTELLIKNY